MDITQNMIDEAMTGAVASLKQSLIKELQSGIDYQIKTKAAEQISDFVTKWIKANVLPEIESILINSKSNLISAAEELAGEIGKELSKNMIEHFKKKMEASWNRSAIFKAMFG